MKLFRGLILVVMLGLAGLAAQAQSDVPGQVKTVFGQMFKSVQPYQWSAVGAGYYAFFEHNGDLKYAYFNKTAKATDQGALADEEEVPSSIYEAATQANQDGTFYKAANGFLYVYEDGEAQYFVFYDSTGKATRKDSQPLEEQEIYQDSDDEGDW